MNPQELKDPQPRRSTLPLWLAAILVVALLALAGFWIARQNAPAAAGLPDTVTVAEAAQMRAEGVYMVDVRTPAEYEAGHIEGVPLIPIDELASRLDEVPKDQPVVFVCQSGGRSARARDLARDAGYTQVTSMDGGMGEWQAQNLPFVTGK